LEVFPKGYKKVIAQFVELEDAILFLQSLVLKYDDSYCIFAISTIEVSDSESIRRYQVEEDDNETNS
jgi:hypothetical protein